MTEKFILDSSVAVAWFIEDEKSTASKALGILKSEGTAIVPPLWLYEISNALATAQKRQRLPSWEINGILKDLFELNVEVDAHPAIDNLITISLIAQQFDLSVYDSTYLELAVRYKLPLATNDKKLAQSARKAGIATIN